jgi:hypothetical protein
MAAKDEGDADPGDMLRMLRGGKARRRTLTKTCMPGDAKRTSNATGRSGGARLSAKKTIDMENCLNSFGQTSAKQNYHPKKWMISMRGQ